MGEISDKLGSIPLEMPESYHKAFQENSPILEQLFGVCGNTTTATNTNVSSSVISHQSSSGNLQNLLHFLDVYVEIFDYSAKQSVSSHPSLTNDHVVVKGDSPILRQCIAKFREIFRQGYRGVHYLPGKKLEQVEKKAEIETHKYFERLLLPSPKQAKNGKETGQLIQMMSLELCWIRKINEHRRNKDFVVMILEAVENFKVLAAHEFPYLYDDNSNGEEGAKCSNPIVKYCEEPWLVWKLEEMVAECRAGFKEQVPFKEFEDERVFEQLYIDLNYNLQQNVISDLKSRNSAKRIGIQAYMDNLVDNCVEKYEQAIAQILKEQPVQMDMVILLGEHNKIIEKFRPKFILSENSEGNGEIGTHKHQVHCWNNYNSRTFEIFQNMVIQTKETAKMNLASCQEVSSEEIEKCLTNVTEILGKYGMTNFHSGLRSHVEGGLQSIFNHVRVTNESSIDALLQSAKPVTILTKDEIQYMKVMEKCKATYSKKLIDALQESTKFPYSVDGTLLQACHEEAKKTAINSIHEENVSAYLGYILEIKLCQFVDYFILRATSKKNVSMVNNSAHVGTPIKFEPVTGTDIETVKGKDDIETTNGKGHNKTINNIKTCHQCISLMLLYENKSLEELQLEDRLYQFNVIQKITELLDKSASFCELVNSFESQLNFHKISGQNQQPGAGQSQFLFSPKQQDLSQTLFAFSATTPSNTNKHVHRTSKNKK